MINPLLIIKIAKQLDELIAYTKLNRNYLGDKQVSDIEQMTGLMRVDIEIGLAFLNVHSNINKR